MPMKGLPSAVPRLSSAVICVPCSVDRPIDRAKSDREYNRVMYPNILMKAHINRKTTSQRNNMAVLNGCCIERTMACRSRMKLADRILVTTTRMPINRSAQL